MEDGKAALAAKDASGDARSEAARLMGSVSTEAKAEAARANGRKGGRPAGTGQSPETRAKIAAAIRAKAAEKKAGAGA